jgi:hypothetical protein
MAGVYRGPEREPLAARPGSRRRKGRSNSIGGTFTITSEESGLLYLLAPIGTRNKMAGRIRVISERVMSRGFEGAASRFMDNVKNEVMSAPGLLSLETLKDMEDHKRYVTLSEVSMYAVTSFLLQC